MSISTVVTRGYGSFGSIADVVVRGYLTTGVLIEVIDTHDGEKESKRYREKQERRRKQIEEAFDAAFSIPEMAVEAKQVAANYLPKKAIPTRESIKADFDFERFALNPSHLAWVEKILKQKRDNEEEQVIMAYLATRH